MDAGVPLSTNHSQFFRPALVFGSKHLETGPQPRSPPFSEVGKAYLYRFLGTDILQDIFPPLIPPRRFPLFNNGADEIVTSSPAIFRHSQEGGIVLKSLAHQLIPHLLNGAALGSMTLMVLVTSVGFFSTLMM